MRLCGLHLRAWSVEATILCNELKNYSFKVTATSPRSHWVNWTCMVWIYIKWVLYHEILRKISTCLPSFSFWIWFARLPYGHNYRKTSSISRTLVGNKIVDNSDVVGASPVGAAPTTSSFSTEHLASMDWAKTTARWYKKHLSFGIWCD